MFSRVLLTPSCGSRAVGLWALCGPPSPSPSSRSHRPRVLGFPQGGSCCMFIIVSLMLVKDYRFDFSISDFPISSRIFCLSKFDLIVCSICVLHSHALCVWPWRVTELSPPSFPPPPLVSSAFPAGWCGSSGQLSRITQLPRRRPPAHPGKVGGSLATRLLITLLLERRFGWRAGDCGP